MSKNRISDYQMARNFVRHAEKKKQFGIVSDVTTDDPQSRSSSSSCRDMSEASSDRLTTPEDSDGSSSSLSCPDISEVSLTNASTPEDSEACFNCTESARSSSQDVKDSEAEGMYKIIFNFTLPPNITEKIFKYK